jgi:hypothetical protein
MIDRGAIVEAVRRSAEPHDWARAMYVAGSESFGRVDRWSDVDVALAVADGRVEDGFLAIEKALTSLAPIETCWRIFPNEHEKPQRVYRLADVDPFLIVDTGVLPVSTPPDKRFVERRRHGTPRVIFDRDGFTADVPADPAALRERLRARLAELKLRFSMTQTHPQKSAFRGEVGEAVVFYHSFTLRPLVELLRMKHDPWRHDFDVRYLRFDLPEDVRRRLDALWLVRDLADLLAKRAEAEAWFRKVAGELDVDAVGLG